METEQKRRKKEQKQQKKQLMAKCIEDLEDFQNDETSFITFPSTLEKSQRKELHMKAQSMGLTPKYSETGESICVFQIECRRILRTREKTCW